jgi:hypothetical protein
MSKLVSLIQKYKRILHWAAETKGINRKVHRERYSGEVIFWSTIRVANYARTYSDGAVMVS